MQVWTLDENHEREVGNVAIELRNVGAEPGSGRAADHDAEDGDDYDEFDVVPRDAKAAVSKRLQQADLLAFKRDNTAKCQIDEKGGNQEKNRRQRTAHVPQHVEPMVDIGMRILVSAAIGGLPAVGIEQRVELLDDLGLRCVTQQLDLDVGESAVEIVRTGKRLL